MSTTSDKTRGLIGVLGGMGPLATIDFMHKLLAATPADADQDHVPVIVSSIPQVPDRAAAFRGEGVSPLAAMIASGRRLVRAGAALVLMPCNTAHLWFDEVQGALGVPMLHLVDAALEDAIASLVRSGEFEALYKKWFQSPIPPKGINLNAPMSKELRDNLKNLSDRPAT